MGTQLDLDTSEEFQDEFSNLFGISLRSKRRQQQLAELDKLAQEKGMTRKELEKSLKTEVASTDGDKGKAISNVFNTLGSALSAFAPKTTTSSTPSLDTNQPTDLEKDSANQPDLQVKILGMKPLVAVLVGVGVVSALGFGIYMINKKSK